MFPRFISFLRPAFRITSLSSRPAAFCSASRTFDLEVKCFTSVMERSEPKNPISIMKQFDEFEDTLSGEEHEWMFNTNASTANVLVKLIKENKPKTLLEIGSHMGYSAVLFSNLQNEPGSKLISLEINPLFSSMANSVIKLAGLDHIAESRLGTLEKLIEKLKREHDTFDFIFIDHAVVKFLPDLKLLEKFKMIHDETIIVADNTIFPGAPEYLSYVKENYDTYFIDVVIKPDIKDQLSISKKRKRI